MIKIIKNRSDIGAGTRGADMGIDAIEIAAINKENDYFFRFKFEDVPTQNNTIYDKVDTPFAKRIKNIVNQCTRVAKAVTDSLVNKMFPLVISGDHSSALGTLSGIKAAYPNKRIGAVWIDAHADLHSPYTSPSGNVHGMPLAAALSINNLECKINTVTKDTEDYWDAMKKIGVDQTKIKADDLVYFGVRDTETPEDTLIERLGIKNYKVEEVRYRGLDIVLKEAINRLKHCDMIYVSFDVDSMDCDLVSYGTGTPVAKGFDPYEVTRIINKFIETDKVVCLELVEVNPLLDHKGNKMAETAFEVLDSVTQTLLKHI